MSALTCQCCGITREFASADEAFQAGWDEPEHLPSWPVSCDLCPGVAAMGTIDHSAAHARWEREGRPATFEEQYEKGDLERIDVSPELEQALANLGVTIPDAIRKPNV